VIIDHGKAIAEGTLAELVDRTVGRHRLVTLRLDKPLPDAKMFLRDHAALADTGDATQLRARLTDVAYELPLLLERVRQAGRAVEDVDVRGPSLQSVFIHLTGRELRE
jgi:ABC-2 type transport system ATP-binding protein